MSHRYLGLDIGGTNIKGVVLDDPGEGGVPEVVATDIAPTHAEGGPGVVTERVIEFGREVVNHHGPMRAAGVGVPGLFDPPSGVIKLFSNLPGPWPGHSFRQPLAGGLGLPVTLINDGRAFTLAEGTLGAGRDCHTVIGLTLGTGVGGGLMIGGQLHLGAWGVAGELGHQTVVPDGPLCGCGNRGCLEVLSRAEALTTLAGKASVEEAYAAAASGEAQSVEAVQTVAGYLGIGLANCVVVLGPDRIVIGGGIIAAGALVLDPVRRAMRERLTFIPGEAVEIVAAALGGSAGAIGAALAGLSTFREG